MTFPFTVLSVKEKKLELELLQNGSSILYKLIILPFVFGSQAKQ